MPGLARLTVQDSGPGIALGAQEMIFRRFVTAHSSDGKRDSLGLGLYIARRVVEAHQGQIEIKSEVGKGATFIVTLPIRTATRNLAASRAVARAGRAITKSRLWVTRQHPS
jgi:signal transduction histidine kinase